MIKTEKLVYGSANSSVQFEGSISYEDSFDTPRPGVLVCHAYGGHSDFDIEKSEHKILKLTVFSAWRLWFSCIVGLPAITPE